LLWHDLAGQPPIEITVEGTINGKNCLCGIEFDYANEEYFYCRPTQAPIPPEAANMRVAFLPPMSGLAAIEPKWEPGRIHVLIGEGQAAPY